MTECSSVTPTDYFMIVQNGVNKKVPVSTFLNSLDSGNTIRINPSRNVIDFQVSSPTFPYLLYLSSSNNAIGINTNTPAALFHVNGNIQVGSSSSDGILIHGQESLNYSTSTDLVQGATWWKPLDTARDMTMLTMDTGITVAQFDLGNGIPGQYKTISAVVIDTGAKSTVRVLGGLGFNRIDFTTIGVSLTLKCITVNSLPTWVVVGNNGALLYTV